MCGGKKPSKSRTNRVIGKLYGKKAQQAHAARNGLTNRMKVSNRARSGTTGSRTQARPGLVRRVINRVRNAISR